jgi:hypothetical protein
MKPHRLALPLPFFGPLDRSVPSGERRMLLITMAFPPDQNTGSLRWQKLSAYVAERGWGLDVVTVDPTCGHPVDPSRLAELPAGTRVYGVPTREPWIGRLARAVWRAYSRLRRLRSGGMARVDGSAVGATARTSNESAAAPHTAHPASLGRTEMRWMLGSSRGLFRAYGAWLEYARFGCWARDAARFALRLVDRRVHRVVITSGPPHMTHRAGRLVSRAVGLPFVMDMRDPWSLIQRVPEQLASPLWLLLADRQERRLVRQAALVITNTEPFGKAMCDLYPDVSNRVITVMNGCDEDRVPHRHGQRFIIAYAGVIYLDRDPRPLFRAAARTIAELGLGPAEFGIEFIGEVDRYGSRLVREIAQEEGLDGFVTLGPTRPHRAAREFLAQAALLVSLPQDSDMSIPAKIFEYLQFDAWILALAKADSATGLLLRGTQAAVVAPDDIEQIARVIRQRFLEYRRGIRPVSIGRDPRFSRRAQAETLLDAIAECTSRVQDRRAAHDAPTAVGHA